MEAQLRYVGMENLSILSTSSQRKIRGIEHPIKAIFNELVQF